MFVTSTPTLAQTQPPTLSPVSIPTAMPTVAQTQDPTSSPAPDVTSLDDLAVATVAPTFAQTQAPTLSQIDTIGTGRDMETGEGERGGEKQEKEQERDDVESSI